MKIAGLIIHKHFTHETKSLLLTYGRLFESAIICRLSNTVHIKRDLLAFSAGGLSALFLDRAFPFGATLRVRSPLSGETVFDLDCARKPRLCTVLYSISRTPDTALAAAPTYIHYYNSLRASQPPRRLPTSCSREGLPASTLNRQDQNYPRHPPWSLSWRIPPSISLA